MRGRKPVSASGGSASQKGMPAGSTARAIALATAWARDFGEPVVNRGEVAPTFCSYADENIVKTV